jgi:cytochrome c peroxidase
VVLPGGKQILAIDEARHDLIALSFENDRLSVRTRLAVSPYPVSVAAFPDGKRASVACLWSRRVDVVDLSGASPRLAHTIALPFAPRCQCVLPGGAKLVVADAFGGRLALLDASAGRLLAVHEIHGHNLRGLALSGDNTRLLIAHQVLDSKAPATQENVERGVLMANVVQSIALEELDRQGKYLAGTVLQLNGGDPARIAVLDSKRMAVVLSGANEVALVRLDGTATLRTNVGLRPTAVAGGSAGQPLVIVNTLADSLAAIDPETGRCLRTISLGPCPEPGPAQRGERLFFDASLGRGRMSCHSCHTDGHTNGLLADTLGDDTFGTPKRILTLMNTALTDPWAWNGEVKYLHDQVDKSLRQTMHTTKIHAADVGDLTTFLHTLPPPPPSEPVTADEADRQQVERGRQVFTEHGCVHCHIPPLTYSSHLAHDVGFADERGLRKFNPPSLRGVGQGYRFLHDNRAATLEEVFTKYRHKVGSDLPAEDLTDLLRFLRSL